MLFLPDKTYNMTHNAFQIHLYIIHKQGPIKPKLLGFKRISEAQNTHVKKMMANDVYIQQLLLCKKPLGYFFCIEQDIIVCFEQNLLFILPSSILPHYDKCPIVLTYQKFFLIPSFLLTDLSLSLSLFLSHSQTIPCLIICVCKIDFFKDQTIGYC